MSATVCVLQHAEIETPGRIADALAAAGCRTQTFLANPPSSLAGFDGLLVMGGPQSVYEQDRYPFLRDELRLIEQALRTGKPMLGVCLGSQLLAAALGARVYPGQKKEIGWYPVTRAADPFWEGLPARWTAFHWHGDVFDLPAGATALASSEWTACQAFRYGGGAIGLLFHLEVTAAMVANMVAGFAEELRKAGVDGAAVLAGADQHLPALQPLADKVFARWAAMVGVK
jgi:GMP synthase (glutamine-hydrolysing)